MLLFSTASEVRATKIFQIRIIKFIYRNVKHDQLIRFRLSRYVSHDLDSIDFSKL